MLFTFKQLFFMSDTPKHYELALMQPKDIQAIRRWANKKFLRQNKIGRTTYVNKRWNDSLGFSWCPSFICWCAEKTGFIHPNTSKAGVFGCIGKTVQGKIVVPSMEVYSEDKPSLDVLQRGDILLLWLEEDTKKLHQNRHNWKRLVVWFDSWDNDRLKVFGGEKPQFSTIEKDRLVQAFRLDRKTD